MISSTLATSYMNSLHEVTSGHSRWNNTSSAFVQQKLPAKLFLFAYVRPGVSRGSHSFPLAQIYFETFIPSTSNLSREHGVQTMTGSRLYLTFYFSFSIRVRKAPMFLKVLVPSLLLR